MKYINLLLSLLVTTINATVPITTNNVKLNIEKSNSEQNLTKFYISLKSNFNIESASTKYLVDSKNRKF